jgi:hypothetical protein
MAHWAFDFACALTVYGPVTLMGTGSQPLSSTVPPTSVKVT